MIVVGVAEHQDDMHGLGVLDTGHRAADPLPPGGEGFLDAVPHPRVLHLTQGGDIARVVTVEAEATAALFVHLDQIHVSHHGHRALERTEYFP